MGLQNFNTSSQSMANHKELDLIIVGSGLFGSTFARLATDAGFKCMVLERRNHLGGNVYCEDIHGINVHKYGPHIFHTSNRKIWDFVNSYVEFNNFVNSPLARYGDKIFNLPFNMNTFFQLWGITSPVEAQEKIFLECKQQADLLNSKGITTPRNLKEKALTLVGSEIYEKLIKGYTEKQWGRKCEDLPPSIISRIPLRFTFDNNYFNDQFQGIPSGGGYNTLISSLLHGIETKTDTDFLKNISYWREKTSTIIFTGQIDEYFDFKFGHLDYRTVKWETEVLEIPNFQGNAVVNYTDASVPYTRIIEHKHFETFGNSVYENPVTVISREFSSDWKFPLEPFYPVNDSRNNKLLAKYRDLAGMEKDTIFGGRLAEYKYYDMDDVIERAFKAFDIYKESHNIK